jgi:glycosyltransferase involved in cell wall biosynthesis
MSKPTFCLAMIVKDEEQDIQRCLDSVAPYINYWVISDTGSSDGTMDKIKEVMDGHNIPGELHEHKWKDFSTNRNYVLELARPHADIVWFMDADDNLEPFQEDIFEGFEIPKDLVWMNFRTDKGVFSRPTMVSSKSKAKYYGVLHEYLGFDHKDESESPEGTMLKTAGVFARSSPLKRDETAQKKYANDARIFEKDLKRDPSNTRSMYYLAQSYALSGQYRKAIKQYEKRSRITDRGNDDEVFISLLRIAELGQSVGEPQDKVIDSFIRAWEHTPSRLDPIVGAMELLIKSERYLYAVTLGETASRLANPSVAYTNVDMADYKYWFPEMYSFAVYKLGSPQVAFSVVEKALEQMEEGEYGYDKLLARRDQYKKECES